MRRTAITIAVLAAVTTLCSMVHAHNYAAPAMYMAGMYDAQPYPVASDAEMAQLLAMLKSDDSELRAMAARALGQSNNPKAVEPLIAALGDKADTVRMSAALGFCKLRDKRAIKPLIDMLITPQEEPRLHGVYAPSGDETGAYLIFAVPYALAVQGPEAIAEAKKAYKGEDQQSLTDLLDSPDTSIVELASEGQLSVDKLLEMLKSPDNDRQDTAISALGQITGPRVAEALIPVLTVSDKELAVRASYALRGKNASFVLDKLVAIAGDKSSKARPLAFKALCGQSDPRVADLILAALKEPKIRASALEAVGKDTDERVIKVVIGSAKSGDQDAISALLETENPLAMQTVVQMMKSDKSDFLYETLQSLNTRASVSPLLLDGLLVGLHDPSVQDTALTVIGRTGDRRATKYLLPLLGKTNSRRAVILALGWIKDPAALPALIGQFKMVGNDDARYADKCDLINALANYGESGMAALTSALGDKDATVRDGVCHVLMQVKDAMAVDALVAALKDTSPVVRISSATALSCQRDPKAVEPLIEALKDRDIEVRGSAAAALALLKDPRSTEALASLLQDKDQYVRSSAGVGLGLLGDARGADVIVQTLRYIARGQVGSETSQQELYREQLDALWLPAIEAAGILKNKRAAKPIVDSLPEDVSMSVFDCQSEEGMTKSRETKLAALRSISGQDFGHAYYRWTAWAEYAK